MKSTSLNRLVIADQNRQMKYEGMLGVEIII